MQFMRTFARRCVKQNRSLKNKRQRQLSNCKRFLIFTIVSHNYHTIIIILVINIQLQKSYFAVSLFSKSRITQMIDLINIVYTSASMVCLCPVNAS